MTAKEITLGAAGAAFALFCAWVALGLYGAAIGSDDDCTRSLGAAVRWVIGTEKEGGAE